MTASQAGAAGTARRGSGIKRRSLLGLAAAFAGTCGLARRGLAADRRIYLYNWDEYIGENTLAGFAELTGIEVTEDLFADSDEQFAKLRLGGSGYDVTIPTHDYVERLWRAGLLHELEHSLIPNIANLDPAQTNPTYDPGMRHSIPYMWGTMGIGYRKSAIAPPRSWRDVFTAEGIARTGRVSWLSEASSIIPAASRMLGESVNNLTEQNLKAVVAQLTPARQRIVKIAGDSGQDLLAAGEVDAAVEWNGDIAQLISEDDDIGFVVPDEGSIYFVDCLAILADTQSPAEAHEFINYILDPQVGSSIAEYIGYATPNQAALALASDGYRNNTVTFPPANTKLETFNYPGEAALDRINRHWEAILTG